MISTVVAEMAVLGTRDFGSSRFAKTRSQIADQLGGVILFVGNRYVFLLASVLSCTLALTPFTRSTVEGSPKSTPQTAQNKTRDKSTITSPVADTDLDTAHWRTVKNKYGWEIKYPKNWYADSSGDATPETSGLVEIGGPEGCQYASRKRCALIQIDAMIFQGESISNSSVEQYLGTNGPRPDLRIERKFALGGVPAVDVCYLVAKGGAGAPQRKIAVKHNGRILEIRYIEQGKDEDTIKSPSDWKYAAIFDKMLTTFSFYRVPETVWPKP